MSWSGPRWPLRCRPPGCLVDRKVRHAALGKRPAQRADGPSACPGNSLHERGRVGRNDAIRDMQQAAKSIRVRNAGEVPASGAGCLREAKIGGGPAVALIEQRLPCASSTGCRVCRLRVGTPGAAGAVKRPAFRTPPRGKRDREDRLALRRINSGNDFARPSASEATPFFERLNRRRFLFGANRASPARALAGQRTEAMTRV